MLNALGLWGNEMKIRFYGNWGWVSPTGENSCFSVYGKDTKLLFDAGSPRIINDEEVDFTLYPHSLHNKSYEEIVAGRGFGLHESKPAISLCEHLNNAEGNT